MPGRGPQTFKKRQKEQQRKEKQEEKMAKRLARKNEIPTPETDGEAEAAAEPDSAAAGDAEHPNAGGFAA